MIDIPKRLPFHVSPGHAQDNFGVPPETSLVDLTRYIGSPTSRRVNRALRGVSAELGNGVGALRQSYELITALQDRGKNTSVIQTQQKEFRRRVETNTDSGAQYVSEVYGFQPPLTRKSLYSPYAQGHVEDLTPRKFSQEVQRVVAQRGTTLRKRSAARQVLAQLTLASNELNF